MAHREEMLPVLDFLESDNKFVVLYHDEANITVNMSQARAWVKSGASHDDPRKKSGAGQGRTAVFFFFCHNGQSQRNLSEFVGVSEFRSFGEIR